METKQFEGVLQREVDPTINFREHPVNKDIVGIYWGDIYTETAIPAKTINSERIESYTDNFGFPHRGSLEATAKVKYFIEKFNTDEEFRNDVLGIEVTNEVPEDAIKAENSVL